MSGVLHRNRRGLSPVFRRAVQLLFLCIGLILADVASADTTPTLFKSFAGNINFTGTAKSLRTAADGVNACSVTTATTYAALSGIPSGATITAAYLYWAGSSTNLTTAPDYTVTFDGSAVSAATNRRYTATFNNGGTDYYYFSGVADVTSVVNAKGNGTYSFGSLTVNSGTPHCTNSAVVAGWALAVIYSHTNEDFRVINVFEGFKSYRGSSITLTPGNFVIPASPINGRHAYITWEGDVGNSDPLNGYSEGLIFNGGELDDAVNPSANQFNSISTISDPLGVTTYGVDFDVYDISSHLTEGETTATSIYRSGGDLVLLSAELISVTNTAVSDLSVTMTRSAALDPGQTTTYAIDVTNNGPNTATGPITVTDTLPAGVTYVSASGSGWSCSASGQTVTCTRSGNLENTLSASTLALTVAVASNASGTKTNTATVAATSFDNVATNNTATDTYTISADLSISMARASGSEAPVAGGSVSYDITVTNDGPSRQPGSITVVDTLPSGLTYFSSSGTGWSCSASGQTVTCVRSGTLDAGGSTATLRITASIASTVSGAITNSATVSSASGLDTNSANDTATNSYTFPALAYYAFDETSWGTIANGGTSGTAPTGVGTVAPTGYPFSTGPLSALTGSPGTCGAASIPGTTSYRGAVIDTGINIKTAISGSAGTIAFWYSSNSAWNDGTDRMLLDASADLGNNNADKPFYLYKRSDGKLVFVFEASASNNIATATTTTSYSYAANTWHHIAITWNAAASPTSLAIYLDGASVATATASNSGMPNLNTLYLGGRRLSSGVGGTVINSYSTTSSANGYLDEVYIYGSALNATSISALKSLRHACTSSVDHYELSIPSSSITCLPTTVTVTACASAAPASGGAACTNKFTGVNGQTATLTAIGGGTLGSTVVTFDGTGTATTTLSYPNASDSTAVTVRLSGESTAATSPRLCCPDGASCTAQSACDTRFYKAGFIFSSSNNAAAGIATIPPQVSGVTSGSYYLRAVKSGTATSTSATAACTSALSGVQTINLAYQCNNPATCYGSNLMTVNPGTATTISRNDNSAVTSYTPVNMTFDSNGIAPFTFNYSDVGQVKLWASKTINGATLTGSTNSFTVRPAKFELSGIAQGALPNPGATSETDPLFATSGSAFSATVTAYNAAGAITPSYGAESPAQGVTLVPELVLPAGGASGSFSGSFGTFNVGSADGDAFKWNEVGVIRLVPKVNNNNVSNSYLGDGGDVGTTGSINQGTNSLSVASSVGFSAGDNVAVANAGVSGRTLLAAVTGVAGNTLTLGTNAATTVSNQNVYRTSSNIGRFYPHHFQVASANVVPRSDTPLTTGTIGAGSNVLNVASAANLALGDMVMVLGAGLNGDVLEGSVTAISGTSVTLSSSASTGVTNANVFNVSETKGTITAGTSSLTVQSATGISVGTVLTVEGAGSGGSTLRASVTAMSGTNLTLASPASTTVANARVTKNRDAFTYMAEPMLVRFVLKAKDESDTYVTTNYASGIGGFAKLNGATLGANWFTEGCSSGTQCFGIGARNGATGLTSRLALSGAPPSAPAGYWAAGNGYFSANITLSRPSTTIPDATWGPYDTLDLGIAPRDTDGVSLQVFDMDADVNASNERLYVYTTRSRMGRLQLSSAHGSELLPLTLGATAQYWNGTAYVTNTMDNSTSFAMNQLVTGGWTKNLSAAEFSFSTTGTVTFAQGKAAFRAARPTGGDGAYDGSVDLSLPIFGTYLPNPNPGRVRYGVFKGNNNFIYLRENY